jgi:glycosyltransferase involved in cell wall biosynthesis
VSDLRLIVVAADLNNNVIDGSVIWLRNVLRALSRTGQRGRCIAVLREIRQPGTLLFPPGCTFEDTEVLDPAELSHMGVRQHDSVQAEWLVHVLTAIEARYGRVTSILVRGSAYAAALLASHAYQARTCVYTTERPMFASTRGTPLQREIVRHARHLFVPSEPLRRYFEVYVQALPGQITVLPPMVDVSTDAVPLVDKRPVVSYAGELDSLNGVEELADIAPELASFGVGVQVIGNKFTRALKDPQFQPRLKGKLESGSVDWIDGASHADSQRHMQAALFGYCVRSVELDNTVELSTKLLEYCAQGTPPIVRRTWQHLDLFGADYPYFADSPSEVISLLAKHPRPDPTYCATVERLSVVARRYALEEAAIRLRPLYSGPSTSRSPLLHTSAPRLLVATHASKFLTAALDRMARRGSASILFDRWSTMHARAADNPIDRLPEADVVWCEWCCEQAVWWSHNKRPTQTLIVRLHRFEAFTPFPRQVDWTAVNHLIVVSDYFRRLAIDDFGIPEHIIRVLPQYVDTAEFDRPKLHGANFTIGLVGIIGFWHKRPDRAVKYIEALAKADPRFRLRVRSRMPWEFPWLWERGHSERTAFTHLFQRCLEHDLRERVLFDRAGSDMAEWFRGVTAVLSTSDSEGCHTSVAEGMAAGCLPVCWAWPGARSVYPDRFVHDSVDAMVDATLAAVDQMHSREGREAIKVESARFDIGHTLTLMEELIA